MKINRSDNPDFSLIGKWLRRELNGSKEFRLWILGLLFRSGIKFINRKN